MRDRRPAALEILTGIACGTLVMVVSVAQWGIGAGEPAP